MARLRHAGAVLVTLLTAGAGLRADTDTDYRSLLARREALLAEAARRPAVEDVLLRLDEGADSDELWLTLRRTQGAWKTGYGEVPGWHQGNMKDWRGYYHGNCTYGCWRPNLRFPADARKLALDSRRLTGELNVAFRLDRVMAERQPPGTPVQWWDKFIIGGFSEPRHVRYAVEAEVRDDACLLDLVLEDGVYWDDAFVPDKTGSPKPHRVSRAPITVRLQVPATRFTRATAKSFGWVAGFHEAEPAGLAYDDGHLNGTLVVYLHQDGWMPWGRGKHTQHEPLTVSFAIDARLDRNELRGRYVASFGGEVKGKHYNPRGDDSEVVTVPETRYEGAIGGRGGKLVIGRYAAEGAFGAYAGAVDGMLLDRRAPLREQVRLPEGGPSVANINTALHQIRALHLALENETLSCEDALRQTDRPAPVDADVDALLGVATRLVTALPEPGATLPEAVPETVGDSPSYGVNAAAVTEDGANVLPADADGWTFLPRWHVLGPSHQVRGLEHDGAAAPDVVVLPDAGYGPSTQRWQAVTCTDMRLGAPWERSQFFPRYNGAVWYGAAVLRSERPCKVWLSVEASDFAKLWVNDRLVWVDRERTWRYRSLGRQFVPMDLATGDNRLCVRLHNDYQLAWFRLAVTTRKPATPGLEPLRIPKSHPHIFPDPAPPLVWDIEKGINVAWRREELGGGTRPVVVGDAVFVTHGAGTLACLDAATGALRWSRTVDGDVPPPARGQSPAAGAAVAVGDGATFVSGYGTVACFDAVGALRWSVKTELPGARLWACGTRLVVEGQAAQGEGRQAVPVVRVLTLDHVTGTDIWRRDIPGRASGSGIDLTTGDASALLTCTGHLLDGATGKPLPPLDCELQMTDRDGAAIRNVMNGPHRVHASCGMLHLTSQARNTALRVWERDGKLGNAHAWESNYGSSGFGNVFAPGLGTDKYLFTWHSSLTHTPHNPDTRAEVNVQDVRDGRWIARLKPVMDDLYCYGPLNLSSPVVAGRYLYLLGGRSDNSRNQIAVVTADAKLQLVARQDVEPGTTQPPVFAGGRMFLRSPGSLLCVAVTTPEGRQYEKAELARVLFHTIGNEPRMSPPRAVAPGGPFSPAGDVPIGKLMNERPTRFWLGAGPFPADRVVEPADLSAARTGTAPAGIDTMFQPLDRQSAYNEPPAYYRTSELQGTGDITPSFSTWVDPRGISSPTESGLLFTLLDNTRDRIVMPALDRDGVSQWLGGVEVGPGERLRLAPGLYPYVLRVDPEFYTVKAREILPPVNVTNALARGALRDIDWPTRWQVLGPLPGHATLLPPERMREIPETLTVDGETLPLFPFAVEDYTLDLGCLVHTLAGEPPAYDKKYLKAVQPFAAYAFAAIECPTDGYLYVNATCEYFMRWYVDGEMVYDRLKEGNRAPLSDLAAHPFAVRVTKGRHVIVVRTSPGGNGWTLRSAGGFNARRGDELAEFRIESKTEQRPPDFRLQPCFREIAHTPTLHELWVERIREREYRLRAVVRDLPDTAETQRAAALLNVLAP